MSLALVLTAALAAASAGEEPRTENVIEGLEPMRWGKGRDNTWANAYALSLQGAGEDVTYDTVMGYSGAAFRLHFHQPDWCPSSPDATVGYNHAKPAARAFGYAATGGLVDTKDADAVAETRAKIVASIDAGKPVRGIDLVQIPDWGVIVGYRDGGDTLLCRDYHAEGDEYAEVAKFPWIVEFMGDKGRQPSARENVVRALQIAIELADTPRFGGYASGFAAYDSWIADLGDEARYTDADADLMTHMTHVNAWCYDSLTDARASATRFLRASAALVPDAAADLQKIAAEYDAVLDVLREGRGDIVYPSSLKDGATWTPEMRAAAASHLHDAREHETKAVDTIRQALTAEWPICPSTTCRSSSRATATSRTRSPS